MNDGRDPLMGKVRYRLAELGRPLARINTSYDRRPDGTADLVVRILNLGPEAVVGEVRVAGEKVNQADEIRKLAGLELDVNNRSDNLGNASYVHFVLH